MKEARAAGDEETVACAEEALALLQADADARKAAKDGTTDLAITTLKRYGDLSEPDVQSLVLDDKWAATIRDLMAAAVDVLMLGLVARIQRLAGRYAEPVDELQAELEELEAKVAGRLLEMGVTR